jgi:hypothetical protein
MLVSSLVAFAYTGHSRSPMDRGDIYGDLATTIIVSQWQLHGLH